MVVKGEGGVTCALVSHPMIRYRVASAFVWPANAVHSGARALCRIERCWCWCDFAIAVLVLMLETFVVVRVVVGVDVDVAAVDVGAAIAADATIYCKCC